MIVWTQQDISFLDDLEQNGIAYCTRESWLCNEYRFAYDWMVKQMHLRLGPPPMPQIKYPLWCWVQYGSYKARKPKFTPNKVDGKYLHEVFIEADIPEVLLLESNFHLWGWHCMNGWHIGDKALEREVDAFAKANHIQHGAYFHQYTTELQGKIQKSWECIFDMNYRNKRYNNRPRRNKSIQATFWLLRKEWVRSVRFYTPLTPLKGGTPGFEPQRSQ